MVVHHHSSASDNLPVRKGLHIAVLRTWVFHIAWAFWTVGFALFIPFLWMSGTPPRAVRQLTRIWARGMLALLAAIAGVTHVARGRDRLPQGPSLILANHQSPWETVAALVLFPDVAIVAKRELLKLPVLGWYLRHSPMVIINRNDTIKSARAMVAECSQALAEGRSVLIFPEGTRMPVGAPIILKRGVELLYRSLGVPAVVFAHDAGRFWRQGSVLMPGVITATFLPPLPPGLSSVEFLRRAVQILEAEIHGSVRREETCAA